MTAFPWPGSKASSLWALRRTVDLAELLAVVGSFTPASFLTTRMARWAVTFRRRKVINIHIGCILSCNIEGALFSIRIGWKAKEITTIDTRKTIHRIIEVAVFTWYNLAPFDWPNVTEIVIVEHPYRSIQNISESRHLQRLHLRERCKKSKFVVPHVEFEECSATNNLQARKSNVLSVNMTN